MAIFQWGPPNGGVEYGEYENIALLTNFSVYLGNDTRYSHSYYGIWIGNHTAGFVADVKTNFLTRHLTDILIVICMCVCVCLCEGG